MAKIQSLGCSDRILCRITETYLYETNDAVLSIQKIQHFAFIVPPVRSMVQQVSD